MMSSNLSLNLTQNVSPNAGGLFGVEVGATEGVGIQTPSQGTGAGAGVGAGVASMLPPAELSFETMCPPAKWRETQAPSDRGSRLGLEELRFPRVIHQIWIQGIEHVPVALQRNIESWNEHMPEWTIRHWRGTSLRKLFARRYPSSLPLWDRLWELYSQQVQVAEFRGKVNRALGLIPSHARSSFGCVV